MINSASFRNFKSLRHVDIELERLTVFVGPNASGKTSILEGLYYLSQVGLGDLRSLFKGPHAPALLHSRGVTGDGMELGCSSEDTAIRLTVNPPQPFPEGPSHPWVFQVEGRRQEQTWSTNVSNDWIRALFGSTVLLRLNATKLAEPSYGDRARPCVEDDGSGLASVLALMALNQPDRFQALQEHLRSVIPAVKRVRFDRVPVSKTETEVVTVENARLQRNVTREYIGDQLIFDFQGAPSVPAHLASEGTILTLGLIAALLGPERPRLILLDDLERGLHPKAQREIVRLLRMILDENQDLQIIATTHSPYPVNELDPKEVRITWASEDGATRCAPLGKHPDFERWKDELWPGEFWSVVGEQWVGDGQGRESP